MNKLNRNLLVAGVLGIGAYWAFRTLSKEAYNLKNKVVLITGGSRGLGLVLARQLAKEGARVAICARDEEALSRAAIQIQDLGGEVFVAPCDLMEPTQIETMIASVTKQFAPIDVLINNAGVIELGPIEVITKEDFEEAMKVHFWAPLHTMLKVIPAMKERGGGKIINISSVGGKLSIPHMLPYSTSKFALTALSEGMYAELKKDNIIVTTVCPGLMRTGSPPNIYVKGKNEKEYAWFSIMDSLPGISMNVENAARKIIHAFKEGRSEVTLSLPAKLAVVFHGLFPVAFNEVMYWVNSVLPSPGGIGTDRVKGYESYSSWSPSFLTWLTQKAAKKNNELV